MVILFTTIWNIAYHITISFLTIRLCLLLKESIKFIIKLQLFTKPFDLSPYKEKWTVVTGATDGIGKAFVKELLKTRGLTKFVLIGRDQEKLLRLQNELVEMHDCKIKTLLFDFEYDSMDDDDLASRIQGLEIGMLINCIGMAPNKIGKFQEFSKNLHSRLVQVNLMATIKMIELILPKMIAQNSGIIINFSSLMALSSVPYFSTYPMCKTAIHCYSKALADELRGTNINVQCFFPGVVTTKLASWYGSLGLQNYSLYHLFKIENLLVVDVGTFARQAVRRLCIETLQTGSWIHDAQYIIGSLVGWGIFEKIFALCCRHQMRRKKI